MINNQKGQKAKMLSQDTIVQMFDENILICEDTLLSFVENNSEDEDMIDALHLLSEYSEVQIATGQGYFTLKIKE